MPPSTGRFVEIESLHEFDRLVRAGAAGTVQEIFQAACENYYAGAPAVTPIVLVGRAHWTQTVPAWPLLEALAGGRAMQERVDLVDTIDEVEAALTPPG